MSISINLFENLGPHEEINRLCKLGRTKLRGDNDLTLHCVLAIILHALKRICILKHNSKTKSVRALVHVNRARKKDKNHEAFVVVVVVVFIRFY